MSGTNSNDNTPTLSGTAEANSIINIYDGATLIGTTTADGSGNWTFTPVTALTDGSHSLTATSTDAGGNVSAASPAVTFTADTAAPLAPAITSPTSGTNSNDNTPTLSGTAEANSIINIYDGATLIGTTTADGSGAWTFTPGTALTDGSHSLTATSTDAGGNVSAASPAVTFIADTAAPTAPVITSPASGTNSNDNTPTLSGTAEANSIINIYDGATLIGTTTADGSGNWTFTPVTALTDGSHSLTATSTDAGGNVSAASPAVTFIADTVAPLAPAITSPTSGTNSNDNTPTLSGTAEANSIINIYDGATLIGTTTADGSGAWTFTPTTPLTDGSHSLTATSTDAGGNVSSASPAVIFTADTAAPTAPAITSPTSGTNSNDNTPTFTGTGEPGSVVKVYDGTIVIGTTTVDNSGNWTFTPTTPLTDGNHSITVTVTDAGGNTSSASPAVTFTADTSAPLAPVITSPASGTNSNDNTPTFTGTGEPGSVVKVYDGTTVIGTTTVDNSGNWTFTPTTPLTDGNHSITVTVTDAGGNTSPASNAVTFIADTSAPLAPAITSPLSGTNSNDNTPTFTGTGEPGSVVKVYDGTTVIGTTTVDNSGNWTFTPTTPLTDGNHSITVTVTDAGGNTSPASNAVTFIADTSAPLAPAITSPLSGTNSNDNTPTFTGTGEPGSVVKVYDGTTVIGTTTVDSSGNWTFTPTTPLTDGNHSITVTVTDAGGNTSPASNAVTFIADTSAPLAPAITSPLSGTNSNDNTPTFTGTGEPGSVVKVYDGTTVIGTTTVDNSGNWTFTPTTPLTDGSHSLTATSTDAGGNTSAASPAVTFTADTAAPLAPAITSPTSGTTSNDNTPTLSGTAEANSIINIYDGATLIGTTTADGSGAWTFTPSAPLTDGSHSLTATSKDAGGNTSPASNAVTFIADTAAPTAPAITSPVSGTNSNDNTPTLSGTGEVGSTVTIYDGTTLIGTTTVDNSGNWTFTPSTPLTDGSHSLTATSTDEGGNTSPASNAVTFVADTSAPLEPAITSPLSGTNSNDNTPTFTGTGEPGSVVKVYDGTTVIGTTTVDNSGNWTFTPSTPLTDGNHSITVTVTDAGGNTSPASNAVTFIADTSAPLVPAITSPVSGTNSNDNTPTFTGIGEPGSVVKVYDGTTVIGTTTVDNSGNWTFTPTTPLTDGNHSITVTVTDAGGNTSPASNAVTFIADTSAPLAPAITSPVSGTNSNDNTPTFTGTGEPGSVVKVYDGTTVIGTTTVDNSGNWTFTPTIPLTDGKHIITVTVTDAGGNASSPSSAVDFTMDTSVPVAPVISSPLNGTNSSDSTPTFNGTGEPNSTIKVYDGAALIGTTTVNGSGNWTFTPSAALTDGSHSLTATSYRYRW